jgi:DNA-binding Xre family transcriptional regulator
MKEKEGIVDCPEQQLILYVEKEDGSFGPMRTGSYLTKNYIDDYFEKRQRLVASLKEQIINDAISPIAYYMTLEDLTVKELASRVGISKQKVRKHMTPDRFGDIPLDLLKKYADVFNVPVSDLLGLWKR